MMMDTGKSLESSFRSYQIALEGEIYLFRFITLSSK